jgi:CheY-like chemotaxis protein
MALERILYIDDDEDLLEIVKLALEETGGYSVTACANGEQGVRLAAEWQPDLIMLDVMMPVIDGPATLKRLKQSSITEHIPVVFMTARSSASQAAGYRSMGAAGTIAKPFDPFGLAEQVAGLWEQLSLAAC